MKHFLFVVTLVALVGGAVVSQAQIEPQSSLVNTMVYYTYAQPSEGDETLKGAGLGLMWEQVTWDRQMSIGFGAGYSSSWFDRSSDQFSYYRLPMMAMFKALFGPPKYTGYIGAGLGASIDRLEISSEDGTTRTKTDSPFSIAVPLGIYIAPNPKVGFNFNVTWQWSDSQYLANGSFWMFGFGITFIND
jgi:opacity protein-like surface antigen